MGRRDHEDKRSKRNLKNSDLKMEELQAAEESPVPVDEVSTADDIICDGEVEIPLNDETECVEVEIRDENDYEASIMSLPSTPPIESPMASTSKSASTRKTTPKQLNTTLSPASSSGTLSANNKKGAKRPRRDSGTSSEEERWLNAIESGKLDDVDDELKKMKDPKLMTARQRAMYERTLDKDPDSLGVELLMSLPIGYREKEKPQTAEDIQKAALKSQKRKQLADEKREKDKKKTMDRLLKKQESNKQRAAARSKAAAAATKATVPFLSYRSTQEGAYIIVPPDHEFPLKPQVPKSPPKVQLCGIAGCNKPKVYNCSKTNIPLCSFACYRKNVQAVRQIMC